VIEVDEECDGDDDCLDNCLCERAPVRDLETPYPPELLEDEWNLGFQDLNFGVKQPLVEGRTTALHVGGSHHPSCSFPGDYITSSIKDCYEHFHGSIPMGDLISHCGLQTLENDDNYLWRGNLVVMPMDQLSKLRDHELSRWIEHVFTFLITLPKTVTISDEITVHAPIEVLSGIDTQHIYFVNNQIHIEVGLTTSVQWPFYLDAEQFIIPSNLGLVEWEETTADQLCDDIEGQACTQQWTLRIFPGSLVCELDGKYEWHFSVACHDSVSVEDCPLMGEDATIISHLDSASWCPELTLEGELSGTLRSYKDAELTLARDAFFVDRTVYFKADFFATVALASSEITDVRLIRGDGSMMTLYSSGSATSDGNALDIQIDNSGSHYSVFEFETIADVLNLEMDAIEEMTVECDAQVTYVTGLKRSGDNVDQVKMSGSMVVTGTDADWDDELEDEIEDEFDDHDDNDHHNAASLIAPSLGFLLFVIFALML